MSGGGRHFAIPSRALAREVIGFSAKNQLSWFADLINLQTDKLIIALMIDIRAAAVYEIGSRVVSAVRGASVMAISAIIPTAAARIAEEGSEAIGADVPALSDPDLRDVLPALRPRRGQPRRSCSSPGSARFLATPGS